jgi:hypothetical protein
MTAHVDAASRLSSPSSKATASASGR